MCCEYVWKLIPNHISLSLWLRSGNRKYHHCLISQRGPVLFLKLISDVWQWSCERTAQHLLLNRCTSKFRPYLFGCSIFYVVHICISLSQPYCPISSRYVLDGSNVVIFPLFVSTTMNFSDSKEPSLRSKSWFDESHIFPVRANLKTLFPNIVKLIQLKVIRGRQRKVMREYQAHRIII